RIEQVRFCGTIKLTFYVHKTTCFFASKMLKKSSTMEKHVPYNPDGRPKLDPEEKRSELLKSYVTPAEADLIKIKCMMAGMSISDFLRSLALDQENHPTGKPDELKKIRAEPGKIRSKLNPIAPAVNSRDEFEEERFKKNGSLACPNR